MKQEMRTNKRKLNTLITKHGTSNFSTSILLKTDDTLAKIDNLIKKNKSLIEQHKPILRKKIFERFQEEHLKLLEQSNINDSKSSKFLGDWLSRVASKEDISEINKKIGQKNALVSLFNEKIDSLEKEQDNSKEYDTSIALEQYKLNYQVKKADMNALDNVLEILRKNMSLKPKSSPEIAKGLKELENLISENKQLNEKVTQAHKERQNLLSEALEDEKKKRSLVEDFADPNLYQPSYMDPED
jgi:hypothetical protein